MMMDESEVYEWARRVSEAARYRVNFVRWEDEIPQGWTRPSRLLVHTQSDSAIKNAPGKPGHNPTGEEHFRTDPLWTRPGKLMAAKIKQLQPGSELLVYKYTEDVDGERKSRVLVHFEVLRTPRAGTAAQQPAQEPRTSEPVTVADAPSGEPPVETPNAPPEAHSTADNAALSALETAFEALTSRKRVAYANWARGSGISNPMLPDPDRLDEALTMIAQLAEEG